MPNVKLTDNFSVSADLSPNPASLFAKYVIGQHVIGVSPASSQNLSQTLQGAVRKINDLEAASLQLSFNEAVPLGTSIEELKIGAKASGAFSVSEGKTLFDKELYEKVSLPEKQKYLSTSFKASVQTGFTAKGGDLKFGFENGSDCTLISSHPVDGADTLVSKIEEGLRTFIIPADLEDIEVMPELSVASVEGNGSIKFTVELDAPITPYSLAAIPTGIGSGGISVSATAKVGVQIAPSITGGYKVQVTKVDGDHVLLAYSAKHGSKLEVTFTGSAGISATLGTADLAQGVLKAIIPDAKLPENDLKKLNISEDEIKVMSKAIKDGMQKNLQLSLQAQLDESAENGTAFLYRIDLRALDAAGKEAVNKALDCDLSLIEAKKALSGITSVRSIVSKTREQSRALKLNLFGILNAGSFSEYVQKSEWITDGDTGDVTIIDTLAANEVGYNIDNLAKDAGKLRHVLADGALATCAYKASKTGYQPEIKTRFWAFDLNSAATLPLLRAYLNVGIALRMIDSSAANEKLAAARVPVGRSIFHAELELNDALIDRLFFDEGGRARTIDEYERLGRQALVATLPPDLDADILSARQKAITDDQLWEKISHAGSFPGVSAVLKPLYGNSAKFTNIAADVHGDHLTIDWWAEAMAGVGEPLEALREFLNKQAVTDPHNNTLNKLRGKLNDHLKSAITKTHDRFSEPWGLIAMDLASEGRGEANLAISSPGLSINLVRKTPASSVAARAQGKA